MKRDREAAPIFFRRTLRGLEPVSPFDDERLSEYAIGQDLEVTIKQRRSLPQQRFYWAVLGKIVEATEAYPTSEHLHDAIKMHLGYVRQIKRFDGSTAYIPDSTAFAAMDGAEFKVFLDRALKLLAETFGVDPTDLSSNARRAA